MSHAPLFWLRSLWANGGAPAAFVRRDALLAETLVRLLRNAEHAVRIERTDAFAGLLEQIDFASLQRIADATIDSGADIATTPSERPRTRNAAAPRSLDAHPEAHARRAPADNPISVALRRTADMLAAADRAPEAATAGHALPPGTQGGRERVRTVADALASVSRHVARTSGDDTAEQLARAGAVLSPERAASWRDVGVVAGRHDADEASGIAAILAAVSGSDSESLTPHEREVSTPEAESQSRGAGAGGTIATALARAVQHIEEMRLQETPARRAASASNRRVAADDDSTEPLMAPRGAIARGIRAGARALGEMSSDAPEAAVARSTGLRGLAERTAASRASFFGATAEYVDQVWPHSDFDRMSALLDDAARREGVDLEGAG